MRSVSGPPVLDALADFLHALVRIPRLEPPGDEDPVAASVIDRLG